MLLCVGTAASMPARLDLVATLTGHRDRVWHAAWHPSGQLLATCGGDRSVRFWKQRKSSGGDVASSAAGGWACVACLEDISPRTVRCVEWSPDGNLLACAAFDGKVTVWRIIGVPGAARPAPVGADDDDDGNVMDDSAAGASGPSSASDSDSPEAESQRLRGKLVATMEGHESEVKGVAWNADGTLLASCGRDKSVWLWMLASPEDTDFEVLAVLHGHGGDVKAVRWHPVRELLFSSSYDDTVRVWGEGTDGDWVCVQTLAAHSSTVWGAAVSPGAAGTRLLTAGDDGTLLMWEGEPPGSGGNAHAVDDLLVYRNTGSLPVAHSRTIFSADWALSLDGGGVVEDDVAKEPASLIASSGADDMIVVYACDGTLAAAPAATSTATQTTGADVIAVHGHAHGHAHGDGGHGHEQHAAGDAADACCGGHDGSDGGCCKGGGSEPPSLKPPTLNVPAIVSLAHAHASDINCVRWNPRERSLLASTSDDGLVKLWRLVR